MEKQLKKRVVVVNDDPIQRAILSGLLKKEGLDVHDFPGAVEALGGMSEGVSPALIVTDLYMPEMDGWRFCRLLRSPDYESFNKVPVLVVSATFVGEDAFQITKELGANGFLPAPIDGKRFIEQTRLLLAGESPVSTTEVLIVEDSRTVAQLIRRKFEAHGYHAVVAGTGEEATKRFQEESFDIAILDYHLPDIQGDELLRRFKKGRPECVLIMITADARPDLALIWMRDGAAAYVRKPFDPEYLIGVSERVRRERSLLHVEEILEKRTQQLRASEERLSLALRGADLGMWDWNITNGEVAFNERWAEILGYSLGEISPHVDTWMRLVHPDDLASVQTALHAHMEGKTPFYETQHRLRAKNGEWVWVLDKGKVTERDSEGNPLRAVGTHLDITEQKKSEERRLEFERRIQRSQRVESLGVMAGGVAHHFNSLLMAVLGNLEMARGEMEGIFGAPSSSAVIEDLGNAEKAAQKAAELSGSILTYMGQAKSEKKLIDLSLPIRQMVPLIRSSMPEDIRLQIDLSPEPLLVEADPSQVRQVIANLVTNAREAMEKGKGMLRISLSLVHVTQDLLEPELPKEGLLPGSYVTMEVTDTGTGMDSLTLERALDPFFSTKLVGRGLGLPVALGILKAHGGGLSISSEPSLGTRVRVFFPAVENRREPASQ
jgi:PAS domain S-box-containing protein